MRKTIVLILAFLTFGFAGTAWAQTETGQISETTRFQTQESRFRNLDTRALRETASIDHGVFTVTNLLPAKYSVMTEAQGFAKLEQPCRLAARRQGRAESETPSRKVERNR